MILYILYGFYTFLPFGDLGFPWPQYTNFILPNEVHEALNDITMTPVWYHNSETYMYFLSFAGKGHVCPSSPVRTKNVQGTHEKYLFMQDKCMFNIGKIYIWKYVLYKNAWKTCLPKKTPIVRNEDTFLIWTHKDMNIMCFSYTFFLQ